MFHFFQCRIVESILNNVDYFFECDDLEVPTSGSEGQEGASGDGGEAAPPVDMEAVMNNLTSGSLIGGGGGQSTDALNEISNTMGSQSQLLLSNLQKLEESGKVTSPIANTHTEDKRQLD